MSEPEGMTEKAAKIAVELNRCRRRGLDDLDLHKPPRQKRVEADDLEKVAIDYCTTINMVLGDRIEQIKRLLLDAIAAAPHTEHGNEADAALVKRLFFDPGHSLPQRPGDRLDAARRDFDLTEKKFKELQNQVFDRFAKFLISFVQDAQGGNIPEPPPLPPPPPRPWRLLAIGVALGVVLVLMLIGVIEQVRANTHHTPRPPNTTAATTTSTTGASAAPTGTYTEQEGGLGAHTYNDPHKPLFNGPNVRPFQRVEVSCKVFSPVFSSFKPDGYWYRVASEPWDLNWYVAANTFLNGDTPGGPTQHNTDFKVPDC